MIFSISKDKLPKDYCYILKTNQLQYIFSRNNITVHIDLYYYLPPQHSKCTEINLLSSNYLFPNNHESYCRFYISSAAVFRKDNAVGKAGFAE